jgi:hypothetical protein
LAKGLEKVIPIYPRSKVVFAMDWAGGSQTMIQTPDEPKAAVIFFRKAMAYRGWNVVKGMAIAGGQTIVFSKGGQVLQITAHHAEQEKTTILVNIAQ